MSKHKKCLLIWQAVKLYALDLRVERERRRLNKLANRGVSYSAPEMLAANERFQHVSLKWQRLELEHSALRLKLGAKK